jgi:hypothetical protein
MRDFEWLADYIQRTLSSRLHHEIKVHAEFSAEYLGVRIIAHAVVFGEHLAASIFRRRDLMPVLDVNPVDPGNFLPVPEDSMPALLELVREIEAAFRAVIRREQFKSLEHLEKAVGQHSNMLQSLDTRVVECSRASVQHSNKMFEVQKAIYRLEDAVIRRRWWQFWK